MTGVSDCQIKENRRGGGVSAGPQSHILEGVSWDEARQLQEAAEQRAGGDQVRSGQVRRLAGIR